MADIQNISFDDLQTLARGEAPDLARAIIQFAEQAEPAPDVLPEGALTADAFEALLRAAQKEPRAAVRRMRVGLLWRRYLTQAEPRPAGAYLLADFMVELYLQNREPLRAALVELARTAPFARGLWGGFKRIYKLAEERQDALLFGAVLGRIDASPYTTSVVTRGTLVYLQRRGWRYLRQLARAVPELYPVFAVATLNQLPANVELWSSIPSNLIMHSSDDYLQEAWKRSPDPLMVLLETAQHNDVATFAITSLKRWFPHTLRQTNPEWLARLAQRPIAALHELLVEILQHTPELHSAKLDSLGLKPAVLSLLLSPSKTARKFAIEYARAHAGNLPPAQVVDYAVAGESDTRAWAIAVLEAIPPKQLGLALLSRLLANQATTRWAANWIENHFDRMELSDAFLVEQVYGGPPQSDWARKYAIERIKQSPQLAALLRAVLADPRRQDPAQSWSLLQFAQKLASHIAAEHFGAGWLLDLLQDRNFREFAATQLRRAGSLPDLDIEAVKGLVFDRAVRELALHLLATHAGFKTIGLPWLLALARRSDPALSSFAARMLLGQVDPRDFGDGDPERGVKRLFELATGAKEPDPVRLFAQTYLRCHHPVIGPKQTEAIANAIQPKLTLAFYTPEPYWKALFDGRADVRRFAAVITKAELRRWGYHTRVYDLADSEHREVRSICIQALDHAGSPSADPAHTLTVDELEPTKLFRLTESRIRESREVAMELIAKHYTRLGGPELLAWLMVSADRGVRTMAVRMLWERHRPLQLPPDWKPKGPLKAAEPAGRFANVDVLQEFLRNLMFGLPPGRNPEAREGTLPRRMSAAQTAKRRAIDAARDLAVADEAFARAVAPLFLEFAGSLAQGEWQACLAALTTLKVAHPHLDVGLSLKA